MWQIPTALVLAFSTALAPDWATTANAGGDQPKPAELMRVAVSALVKRQEAGGQWPYVDDVIRIYGGRPAGYRVGGTAIVATALLFAAPNDPEAKAAVQRALGFVLKQLHHPQMAPNMEDIYDVRIWAHAYALEFLCHIRARQAAGAHHKQAAVWIPRLVETLVQEEIPGGGWNYGNRTTPAAVVTAPVVQALLWARSQGEKVPDALFERARRVLEAARLDDGAFAYDGAKVAPRFKQGAHSIPGSIGRAALCETTLTLLGGGSTTAARSALDAFYQHWQELEKRRQKPGTHDGPYSIAPYYFYFAHRYAAQAIRLLPVKERAQQRARLEEMILRTRDADGTWNDNACSRDCNYGTAMVLLALLGDETPLPPKFEKK